MDKLNSLSYAFHYRDIDSTEMYARRAFRLSSYHDDQRAEALNNLAFASIVRMRYDLAARQLDSALALTDNQVELLIAEVQHMRLCQRRSANRAFYEHREQALGHLLRIDEERDALPSRLRRRLVYAESELAIVTSTYYYYVGLERQSIDALRWLDVDAVRHDTAQYLNYLYNVGAGGILTDGTSEQIHADELDYLQRCLTIARRHRYPYFEAQALEALADHTPTTDSSADGSVSRGIAAASEALRLFRAYGDVYQIAGAHRTLASCYHALGDDQQALEQLHLALADTTILQAPDLVASIREQLSVAYAALGDKPQSDQNRNLYLDLQEQTRQDRELEARAGLLDRAVSQLNVMLWAVVGAIVLLLLLLWLFNRMSRRERQDSQLDDLLDEKTDELRMRRLSVERSERRHLEQRAKVSLVNSITPLIDRILYAISRLDNFTISQLHDADNRQIVQSSNSEIEYIRELTDKINEQNDLLTHWIQLRQGELNLHIESFPLAPLFDIVARGRASFQLKGITLDVEPTQATVKADRVLTLFMLNTLADNARKFTPAGGTVTVAARELPDSVELSVSDTGCGMSPDQLAHVFDPKPIVEEGNHKPQTSNLKSQTSHGFGLMNCRGIIEKYRKLSQLFAVCQIAAESEEGRGSRFFFRLPKGVRRIILLLITVNCQLSTVNCQDYMSQAHIFADSAYFCNVNGTYERTLQFADSCRHYLNLQYRSQRPDGRLLMTASGDNSLTPPEIQWLHDSVDVNYQIILDIRNESAVAALALHEWTLYAYNNKVYTQLFKELSADSTLADYCRTMQQSQQNKRTSVILLVILLLLIVPAYYLLYYRHRLYRRHRRERMQLESIELADDELRRAELEDQKLHVANAVLDNCLSALKHETMYYPSRIRQLVDAGDIASLAEVTRYYRDLYAMLSEQAMRQVEQVKLHVRRTELYGQPVLGDENLLRYMFELILEDSLEVRGERLEVRDMIQGEVRDEQYVVYHISLTSNLSPLTSLLCRQIVRDHGEATHRRGCGITVENNNVTITLPRYNGKI